MINFIALVEILQLNNDISDDSMCFKKKSNKLRTRMIIDFMSLFNLFVYFSVS